jgi:hypothetical protein
LCLNNYPLISAKLSDFLLFEKCYNLIKQKQHLTQVGLEQIVALRYNLNKGIAFATDELKKDFKNIVPVDKPKYSFNGIPYPFLISGFVSGDSSFSVSIEKSNNKIGNRVRLIFGTCLHIKDKELLIGIRKYFNNLEALDFEVLNKLSEKSEQDNTSENNKYIYDSKTTKSALLQIKKFSDVKNKIIPFFNKYPILGIKSLDFADFKKVADLIKNKEHLTAVRRPV